MKGFERKNQLFSLCGLNCGLCPMLLGNYCGGCGNGNQSCRIAKCSLEQGQIEYCYECRQYPCEKYQHIDDYDSFITHKRRKADLERAKNIGIEQYNLEQQEKTQILSYLLSNYNDGRRKTFFCVAVNLLELSELQEAMKQIQSNDELSLLPFEVKVDSDVQTTEEKQNAYAEQLAHIAEQMAIRNRQRKRIWKTIGIAFAVIIVVCIILIVMNIAFFSAYPTTEDVQTHEETIMLEE